ncbi:glycosyltransferase family 4 protein [Pseudomonas sp. UBA2684]|uniref:glycosyltransferase family 4 protein n=1 Tax=Pseudomonas sp. UBA2684 TaxID=1947311 RepID=UPI0025ED1315|nr:glycosyltransferase family 4 protein [Pseudomonas sp. UBA2684]|tara:strand:- start:4882 stop:6132 length:1251 start_codon:yes stop_codon:yes gene_type:complete
MPEQKLKVLIVSQYFWPENMRINDLVEGLIQRGHEVTVLTGWPNYPEGRVFEDYRRSPEQYTEYRGAKIVRVPFIPRGKRSITLILNYVSFFVSGSVLGSWKLRGNRYDAIFVYAVSPIMSAIPALVIGKLKKVPVFIWVLDLWPETLKAVGVLSNARLLALVGKVVSWIYNRADYLLLQSKAFSASVKQYCTRKMPFERLVYFPSWAEDGFSSLPAEGSPLIERDVRSFTVLFAGNLGDAQDFPAILDVAEGLRGELPIRWVIVGDGRMSEWLEQQVIERGLDNVFLLGRHPLEAMPALFATADALLVSLKTNEVFEKTIPGKVQAYLASGKPILGMIDGEAARVIEEADAGLACRSGDRRGFARIVSQMAQMSPLQRETKGASGKRYYEEHFSKAKLFSSLEGLFRQATLRGKN